MSRPNYWSIQMENSRREERRKQREQEQRVCTECGGLGQVSRLTGLFRPHGIEWLTCLACSGSGKQEG